MKTNLLGFCIAFGFPSFIMGQSTLKNCNKVKSGTFYFYPGIDQDAFVITREKGIQREIDLKNGDTTYWGVKWKNACELNLTFIRKSQPITNDEKSFYNSHVVVVRTLKVSEQYYVINGGLDSIKSNNPLTDTLWFKPKITHQQKL